MHNAGQRRQLRTRCEAAVLLVLAPGKHLLQRLQLLAAQEAGTHVWGSRQAAAAATVAASAAVAAAAAVAAGVGRGAGVWRQADCCARQRQPATRVAGARTRASCLQLLPSCVHSLAIHLQQAHAAFAA